MTRKAGGTMRTIGALMCCCLLLGVMTARCRADGGVVRALAQDGGLQISAFTSPNPLVSGPVDISVLVQDAQTLAPVSDARIEITITPRDRPYGAVTLPATASAATNKLFRACLVELEPGRYDILVSCDSAATRGQVRFECEVGAAPAHWATLWPWFTWPVVPVVLFGVHLILSRKKPHQPPTRGRKRLGTAARDVYNETSGRTATLGNAAGD